MKRPAISESTIVRAWLRCHKCNKTFEWKFRLECGLKPRSAPAPMNCKKCDPANACHDLGCKPDDPK